ncbi:MAG: hypothetical protein LBQ22_04340 [Bacteroidales bacterium]|jgi:hypothetical protein|nr:hypothetical protein [Bacteroidales bacterium]
MKNILIVIFILFSLISLGQPDYRNIDEKYKTVPVSLTTVENIADYLTKDLNSDTEKVRALYVWITHNLEYDVSQIYGERRYVATEDIINEALVTRKGVCQHYSDLMTAMCNSIGITSYTIIGYVLDGDSGMFDYDHAWNGIIIDSGYYFVDATWSSGFISRGRFVPKFTDEFFMVKPEEFIKTHMPFDPVWQFLDNPVTNREFAGKDFSNTLISGNFNYKDIIEGLPALDVATELEESNKRIISMGVTNDLIREHLDYNMFRLVIAEFNTAVEALNFGISNFNKYLDHKNNNFQDPGVDGLKIRDMLVNAEAGIYYAHNVLYSLDSHDEEISNAIEQTKKLTPKLISDLKKEKEYIERHIKIWRALKSVSVLIL